MASTLPTTSPAETLDISPEGLEVANCFLQCQNLDTIASDLDISKEVVVAILSKREVKAYIDYVFSNVGFNNRFKMRAAMDTLIQKKFQEMEESETGSSKDIAELLALSHKMTMEELDKQIKLETLRESKIKNQVNVQINDTAGGGSNYSRLIQNLINGTIENNAVV